MSAKDINNESFSMSQTLIPADNVYSGPFTINKKTYNVDESVFFTASGIPPNTNGDVLFKRPDGKVDHKIAFDWRNPTNHYFTPVSSDILDSCEECELFGTWTIEFDMISGSNYAPIHFDVFNNLEDDHE